MAAPRIATPVSTVAALMPLSTEVKLMASEEVGMVRRFSLPFPHLV